MNEFNVETHKIKLTGKIKNQLDKSLIYIIENIGLPKKIVYSKINFIDPIIEESIFCFGEATHLSDMKFGIELRTNRIITYGGYRENSFYSIINSNLDKLLLCSFIYDFVIRRLILSESFGAYYENCNYEKYASLLKEMIFDIDKEAAEKGAWASLINEMSIGAI
ncbi:hypothetical protein [Flavobacterium ginsenosidimutans]|uniref:Immunity protein 63 domain-containing protein n=1 Tax=Flavobacterium ginsenosidimutans TaxID=687844 RepID=A0ABZ2Q4J6_9FLAO|nr:hypothetical protein [Flavobacterium ginsenosidimutans]KAF2326491.1 hypothetical protein DM444_21610 [Flavobacterium ginsenosidimutans]